MAVYSMMFMGMAPFGGLFAGFLAQHLGAPVTVAIGGAGCVVGATIFGLQLRSFVKPLASCWRPAKPSR